ncbi:hypothetical protein GPL15_18505 [Clostridium sp. MCC353]|uniref:hypothetical protein n=1 Tax=Clostridium sp. MCC353 TaxID=2592646 RepID=UPI001C038453|nr:hypothetical protein [Clostridium sp. MCC353]MBT9778494.1 hypothetical protein [Clostridium sp. MCC353]
MKIQKRKLALFTAVFLFAMISACSQKAVDIAKEMERGQKFLTEMNYEDAIITFSRVIEIEPRNMEANRMLASAYEQSGKREQAAAVLLSVLTSPEYTEEDRIMLADSLLLMEDGEKASAMAQMAYTQTGDEQFISVVFSVKGRLKDFEGIDQGIDDIQMLGGAKDLMFENLVQNFVDAGDTDSMKQLSELLKEKEVCDSTVLVLDMWQVYMDGGEDGVIRLLETYYDEGKDLPVIGTDEEFYIGGYNEDGKREGYGICFYGEKVKPTSRLYAGYWKEDLRNGEGRAYRTSDYRIRGQWKDDRPEGEVHIYQKAVNVEGSLDQGHVISEMNLYEGGEWSAVHCTADQTKSTGYSFRTETMDNPGICHHVEKHTYCWDCYTEEE